MNENLITFENLKKQKKTKYMANIGNIQHFRCVIWPLKGIKNYLMKKIMRQDKILKGIISIYEKMSNHKLTSIFYLNYKLNWTISKFGLYSF